MPIIQQNIIMNYEGMNTNTWVDFKNFDILPFAWIPINQWKFIEIIQVIFDMIAKTFKI